METAFLLLGSNMGDRYKFLQEALKLLNAKCGTIISQSKIYKSEPWGFEAEQGFLNMALEIETKLDPHILLSFILQIERRLGRTRVNDGKYHSRSIDIDIIFYGNRIVETKDLVIPHLSMHLRRFVLVPLNEIVPDYIHPTLKATVNELLTLCVDKSEVIEYC